MDGIRALAPIINQKPKTAFLINMDNTHCESVEIDRDKKSITFFDAMRTTLNRESSATRSRVHLFAYTMFVLALKEDDPIRQLFAGRLEKRRLNPRLTSVVDRKELASWTRTVVCHPLPSDGYNCGCFALMHLRYCVLGLDVIMAGGSGSLLHLSMVHDALMFSRRSGTV